MSSERHPYIINIEFKIPARSLKEAEHFANLAAQNLASRKSITAVQVPHVWFDHDYAADQAAVSDA